MDDADDSDQSLPPKTTEPEIKQVNAIVGVGEGGVGGEGYECMAKMALAIVHKTAISFEVEM